MMSHSSAIDDEELVHHAARQGHVISLEIYLNQNPKCINKLYTLNQSKWTPLLAACFYKHEHVVRMLLNRFKPDIEAVGEIVFDFSNNQTDVIKRVSPLWAAIAVNHFDIVKLLVEYAGANVKHLTEQGSTTFRIACFNNNLEMARYLIEHGADPYQAKQGNFTNLMLTAAYKRTAAVNYLVNEIKCDINEQDENGQTALYYAIKFDSVETAKILLEYGAINNRDKLRKVTPLIRAALYGKISLVDAFYGHCSDIEWIEARELLAASFAGCVPRIENPTKTIEILTEAFQLRRDKNLPKQITAEPLELFNYRRECETLEQFNQLMSSNSTNALNIEVTLIHQRLLGDMSNDYHHILRHTGCVLAISHQYEECLRWWFYIIDLRQKYNITLKKEDLRQFVGIFTIIRGKKTMTVSIDALLRLLKVISSELSKSKSCESTDYNLYTLLYLITIAAQIIYDQDRNENQRILTDNYQDLLKYIRWVIRRGYRIVETGSSLLHMSTNSSTTDFLSTINYPCWMTTSLLIECGANVDILDSNNNTPLHLLVQSTPTLNVLKMIDLLSAAGAHLDYVNKNEQTPLELVPLSRIEISQRLKKKIDIIQLKCLCARLIRQQQLSYQNNLSTSLVNFIQKH